MASISEITAGTAVINIVANDNGVKQALNSTSQKLEAFANVCLSVGMRLQAAGQIMLQPFLRAAEVFEGFQRQMLRVGAVTGLTGDALAEMAEQAKEAGRAAGYSASQAAGVMGALGMMGFVADEIRDTTGTMLKLARVTGVDTAEAAQIASNNMRVFGFAAKDAATVADILAATANGSAQTLTDLGEALKMAGPIAQMSGASLRETAAALGVLANMGIRGSMAGTALAKSYKQMADPSVQKYLRSLGVDAATANGNLRPMNEVLAELGERLSRMGTAQQLAAVKEIFGDRGALGGGTLAYNADAMRGFNERLADCGGYVDEAAESMRTGWSKMMDDLRASFEELAIAVGEVMQVFAPLGNAIASVVSALAKCKAVVAPVVTVVGALAGATWVFGKAAAVAGMAGKALSTVWSLLSAVFRKSAKDTAADTAALGMNTAEQQLNSGATALATGTKTAQTAGLAANTAAWDANTAAIVRNRLAQGAKVLGLGVLFDSGGNIIAGTTAKAAAKTAATTAVGAGTSAVAGAAGGTAAGAAGAVAGAAGGTAAGAAGAVAGAAGGAIAGLAAACVALAALAAGLGILMEAWGAHLKKRTQAIRDDADKRGKERQARLAEITDSLGKYSETLRQINQINAEIAAEERSMAAAQAERGYFTKGGVEATYDYHGHLQAAAALRTEREKLLQTLDAGEYRRQIAKEFQGTLDTLYAAVADIDEAQKDANAAELEALDAQKEKYMDLIERQREYLANAEKAGLISKDERRNGQLGLARAGDALRGNMEDRRAALLDRQAKAAGFIDVEADQRRRDALRQEAAERKALEEELSRLREADAKAYQEAIRALVEKSRSAVAEAAEKVRQLQEQAQAEGSAGGAAVTEGEAAMVRLQRQAYEAAQKDLDQWQDRLDRAFEGFNAATQRTFGALTASSFGSLMQKIAGARANNSGAYQQEVKRSLAAGNAIGRSSNEYLREIYRNTKAPLAYA